MKTNKINIGLIGCGYWGPQLARVFSQITNVRLHTFCDLVNNKLLKMKEIYPYAQTTTNHEELLKNPDIDAVIIAVPVKYHYSLTKQALLNNKHVLIEKPFTQTSNDAEKLVKLSKEKDKILMVDHTFEYTPAIRKIKEIVEAGEIGDIYYIHTSWLNLGLLQPDVNVVFDLATHVFSSINYITGLFPISVQAIGRTYIRSDIEEMANIIINYPNKIIATVNVSWLEPCKVRQITIVGSKKMLVYDFLNQAEQIKIYDKGVDINDVDNKISYRSGDIYSPKISLNEPLLEMALHFVECIKEMKIPLTDASVGLKVVKLLECTNKSLKNNGVEVKL